MIKKVNIYQWSLEYYRVGTSNYSLEYKVVEAEEKPNTYRATSHFANYHKSIKKSEIDTVISSMTRIFYVSFNNDEDVALKKLLDYEAQQLNNNIERLEKEKQYYQKRLEKIQIKDIENYV